MSTGAIVGAAVRRAERRLVEHLREAGATSPAAAGALANLSWMDSRVLRRLVKAGSIREAESGYYLDEIAYETYGARRRRNAIIMMSIASAAAALIIWWASTR